MSKRNWLKTKSQTIPKLFSPVLLLSFQVFPFYFIPYPCRYTPLSLDYLLGNSLSLHCRYTFVTLLCRSQGNFPIRHLSCVDCRPLAARKGQMTRGSWTCKGMSVTAKAPLVLSLATAVTRLIPDHSFSLTLLFGTNVPGK